MGAVGVPFPRKRVSYLLWGRSPEPRDLVDGPGVSGVMRHRNLRSPRHDRYSTWLLRVGHAFGVVGYARRWLAGTDAGVLSL